MPIDKNEVIKAMNEMKEENTKNKPIRKARKEMWKQQSLKDSLYNDENGQKIPRISDIDQGSDSKLNYILKQHFINDCFLLTNLMGLAKTRPNFILNELIKIKNDDEVEVLLYKHKLIPKIKDKEHSITIIFEPDGKVSYSVTKNEALNWKTSHKALWPVVIEIAYAKLLKDVALQNKEEVEKQMRTTLRPILEQQIREKLKLLLDEVDFSDEEINKSVDKLIDNALQEIQSENLNLRDLLKGGGTASVALTNLTGVKSKTKGFIIPENLITDELRQQIKKFKGFDTKDIKTFSGEYSPQAIKIFNNILKNLRNKKIITVSFKGVNPALELSKLRNSDLPKTDNQDIALAMLGIAKALKYNAKAQVDKLLYQGMIKKEDLDKWLKDNNFDFVEELEDATKDIREKFALDMVDFDKQFKISKTKTCIGAAHGYLVDGTFEYEGYNYVVLRNPHNLKTNIDYTKSEKLKEKLKEIKLPEQLNKEKNECIMELNNFVKKLSQISYDK